MFKFLAGKRMQKIALAIGGFIIVGIVFYLYLSPSIAFHEIEATIAANDLDAFAAQMDANGIQKHFMNRMSLEMQDALRSYSTHLDPATAGAHLVPYFRTRSKKLSASAFVFRELASQLKGRNKDFQTDFRGASTARISWTSLGKFHEVLLSRHGLFWKLSAFDAEDAMPKFWDRSVDLTGIYHQSSFTNCCVYGKATDMPYNQLQLSTAIDLLDADPDSDPAWNMLNVAQVQIGINSSALKGVNDGDVIEVHCKQLWQGDTGHYALPVYCDADTVKHVIVDK